MLNITYLFQSGYAILTDTATIVIDYYSDSCAGPRCLSHGVVAEDLLSRPGKFYVLCSHQHADHFSPVVLSWKKQRPDIIMLFSDDIRLAGLVRKDEAIFLNKGDTYRDDVLCLTAYGSTDLGISFVLSLEGKTIFHAGDLNNWHWNQELPPADAAEMERAFLQELSEISAAFPHLDVAMFPVDPRLGKDYMKGALQFIKAIDVDLFIPMHFGQSIQKAQAFAPFATHHFFNISHRGQSIELELPSPSPSKQ